MRRKDKWCWACTGLASCLLPLHLLTESCLQSFEEGDHRDLSKVLLVTKQASLEGQRGSCGCVSLGELSGGVSPGKMEEWRVVILDVV